MGFDGDIYDISGKFHSPTMPLRVCLNESFITPGILFRGTLIGGCQAVKHSRKLGKFSKSSETFNKVGKYNDLLLDQDHGLVSSGGTTATKY
jgi:hypothetical protein